MSMLATILGLPTWEFFKPFIITGLALGGVYAVSGVGMVVLYRTTGVLNLAFGAVGAMGAFVAWELMNNTSLPDAVGIVAGIAFGGTITLLYGSVLGPPLAGRDPLTKSVATLGLALILLGTMSWIWSDKARSLDLATTNSAFAVGDVLVTWTQVIGLAFGVAMTIATVLFLRLTRVGTAMRALASNREVAATLGVPVRRVEAAAWLVSGMIAGATGILLANLVGLDAATLTFLIISALAAGLMARLESVVWTLAAGLAVGMVTAMLTPILSISQYRDMAPFAMATIALLVLAGRDIRIMGVR